MAQSLALIVSALVALQLGCAQAQRTEGSRKTKMIGVVRQDGVPVIDDRVVEAAGSYTDPRRNGALRQVKVSGSDITITGTKRGQSWTATGTIDGNKISIDMSAAGDSEDMDGTVYASGIEWSDGNSWSKRDGASASQGAANRKSKASKRASDANADIVGMDMSMDVDVVESDSDSDSDMMDSEQDGDASEKPGHLPRILFIVFLIAALLVMGTDEGMAVYAKLQERALLALGQTQALAKTKDPRSLFSNAIVNEAASVMEFGQGEPRRPRESRKAEVSSVIDEAFEQEDAEIETAQAPTTSELAATVTTEAEEDMLF